MDDKECKLPVKVINGVIQYLQGRPFQEVAVLIQELQKAAIIEEESAEKED